MCGIAAIYAYHHAALPVDRDELAAISVRMSARGPDGEGAWFSADGRQGLAHRRLSIIDLDARATQPMKSADAACVLSFNGEIYNYRALRSELEASGVRFRTQSDTEVILALYQREGEAMLKRLRGMFAIVLWDSRRRRMLIARDPYGIKPLYYADDGWTVRIASQVKALLASPKVSRIAEPAGLIGFALFGSVPEPFTLWQEIHALPAGHLAWIDEGGMDVPRAYDTIGDAFRDADVALLDEAALLGQLRDSVAHHLVADVPVGVFLSSGVDSSALLGAASDRLPDAMHAITIGFDEFSGLAEDEVPLAAEMVTAYRAQHHVRRVGEAEFQADLPAILDAMDQPSIDGFNTWFAAKAAREAKLKVMLSGVGGDELFAGYDSFGDIPRWRRAFALTTAAWPTGLLTRKALAPFCATFGIREKAATLPELGGTWAGAYLLRRGIFMPWELSKLFAADVVEAGLHRLQWQSRIAGLLKPALPDDHARVAVMESSLYMRNQLLRDSDWASMAHGVEVRTPLVDAHLLQAVARTASSLRRGQGKQVLARMPMQALPARLVNRPKTGFSTPVARWMQGAELLQGWRRHRFLHGDRVQPARRLVAAMLESR